MRPTLLALLLSLALSPAALAQKYRDAEGTLRVALVVNPFTGSRSGSDVSQGPELLRGGGLEERLALLGCRIVRSTQVELTPEEQRAYGQWNRLGLANGHLW
ncbi:MAG: hypothetical protein V3T22_06055, partial [Planctomycetota bacterium]